MVCAVAGCVGGFVVLSFIFAVILAAVVDEVRDWWRWSLWLWEESDE
jgi:hypothetical protein